MVTGVQTCALRSVVARQYHTACQVLLETHSFFDWILRVKLCHAQKLNRRTYPVWIGSICLAQFLYHRNFDPAKAVKVTIVRPIPSGALGETDVYGAQQHAPLMKYEFEL